VQFSPDGKYIVSGSADETIRLWDLQGNPIGQPFTGHTSYVVSVQFSPDGKYIVSGSRDKTIRLWDLQGNPIGQPFTGHTDSVYSVQFSPDGKYIVSGSRDETIRLWEFGWEQWLKLGCQKLKEHPVLRNPQTETEKEARAACEKYGVL
jgi:WD40 repeat protein